jgi:hypothetical protein
MIPLGRSENIGKGRAQDASVKKKTLRMGELATQLVLVFAL